MKSKYIFVYGTLKVGGKNNFLLRNSEYIGRTYLDNHYMFNNGWFPYILHKRDVPVAILQDFYNQTGTDEYKVLGEVWKVSMKTLKYIRTLEGVPTHYKAENFEFSIEKWDKDGLIKRDIRGIAEFYVSSHSSVAQRCKPIYNGYFNVDRNSNVRWNVIVDENKVSGNASEIVRMFKSRTFDEDVRNNVEYMESVNNRLHKFHRNSKLPFEDESHFLNFLASKCIIAEWDKPENAELKYA